jgi:hypothetical protein
MSERAIKLLQDIHDSNVNIRYIPATADRRCVHCGGTTGERGVGQGVAHNDNCLWEEITEFLSKQDSQPAGDE